MNYEKAWKKLREETNKSEYCCCTSEEIIDKMNKLEEEYEGGYICTNSCIRKYNNEVCKFNEYCKYEVVDQDRQGIYIEHPDNERWILFTYDEFNNYFQENKYI